MKSAYPKVSINLLGNLHQHKIIHVLMEGQEEASNENPGNEQIMSEMNN